MIKSTNQFSNSIHSRTNCEKLEKIITDDGTIFLGTFRIRHQIKYHYEQMDQ